ncbi:ABC transporter substrate-binding protein [Actinopolymorpha sp. B11F2]|uniref:ABC transporter substrate-binding protein n=1 Tax=Actinopolymorpha sp. B11F2 TaxID=3160862 RepID=UPI0032E4B42F
MAEASSRFSRRRLLHGVAQGIAWSAPAMALASCTTTPGTPGAPGPAQGNAPAGLKQVPRNRTLVLGITGTSLTDFQTFNPYLPGIATSTGYPYCFEPLFYYNAFHTPQACGPEGMTCDEGVIPWLAEAADYNEDFTGVTIRLRDGVTWNDGNPFTAADVAFTFAMLRDNAPKLTWSVDLDTWVQEVTTPDDHTVEIALKNPNPRFVFSYLTFHMDIGIPIVPEHVWKDQDPNKFTFLDIDKGWPVTTSPWKIVASSQRQRIYDRSDDWWGERTGFTDLPAPERIMVLPGTDETKMVQMSLNNEADLTIDLRPNTIKSVLQQNEAVTTWTGDQPPYGYLDWWPISLGFNDSKAPFDDPEIRWAINHAIDRRQLVDLGYQGAGQPTLLPFPNYPALLEYLDPIKDLSDPIDDHAPDKTAEIMQGKGYEKDGKGFWAKDGTRFPFVIYTLILFQDITPVLVQQLRKAGFDASFKQATGPDFDEHVSTGNMDAFILGHGGSVSDPYFTLRLYQSRYAAPTGERGTYPYRWSNKEYDRIVDEMGTTSPEDPKLHDLFRQAMEIWVPAMPDIGLVQWFHRIPTNTTYWTNWPSADNPYINTAYWHRTSPLWIHSIKPTQ